MPELPEVETIVRGLSDLRGAVIERVEVFDPRLCFPNKTLTGAVVETITRRGKYIVFEFSGGRSLAIHLRMSGRLTRSCSPKERKHLRFSLHLDRGTIHFINPRRLGTVTYSDNGFPYELGIEPLGEHFTPARLEEMVQASRAPIKALLMDQKRIAGIGNIYAMEALWQAKIDPRCPGKELSNTKTKALHAAVQGVLKEAITQMGSTLGTSVSDYRNTNGEEGTFQHRFAVYNREGEGCVRCGAAIERIKQSGRSTYFCPNCQR
jgi:formamidopyrimidine-DNA glycosylase